MISQVISSNDLLQQFTLWADRKREAILAEPLFTSEKSDRELNQGAIFHEDFNHHVHTFSAQFKYEAASLAKCIATIAITPFAVFGEFYRLCNRSINASTCLKNICIVPKHIISSIFKSALYVVRVVNKTVTAASICVGFLAWHGGERLVRLINGASDTVLSNHQGIRDVVYNSIGVTLLAAATVFIPFATIQMIALPVILGSVYGTINNQFTVRECPEYYTMGHYYDGTDLKGHAVKTNNLIIKPIVTGCYATTMVTKIAGVILAATGTLPFTSAVLPMAYAATMIAGVSLISLVAAHVFSSMKKKSIQKNLDAYASLIGIQWTDSNRNISWRDLAEVRDQGIEKRRQELGSDAQELEKFNQRLQELTTGIESNILNPDLPVKYIVGWQANNTRNTIGYIFAGGGTLAIAISTIFLRIFAL